MLQRPSPTLVIDAPSLLPTPRAPLAGEGDRRPDPAQVGLQSAIINSFDCRPAAPYPFVGITIGIPDVGDTHAAGAMKLIVDAVKKTGLVRDDRNEIDIVRLHRYRWSGVTRPTVNVKVLERQQGDGCFIKQIYPNPDPEPGSAVVGTAVSYAYVTGRPGEVEYERGPAANPAEYEKHLGRVWHELEETGCLSADASWAASSSVGHSLTVLVPQTGNFDPDNVLLYVLDLLEVARRVALGADAGEMTIDQLLAEVVLARHDSTGVRVYLEPCTQMDEATCLMYFRGSEADLAPKWPDTVQPE